MSEIGAGEMVKPTVAFDMGKYANENSIANRLTLAQDYCKNADANWIFAYQTAVKVLPTFVAAKEQHIVKVTPKDSGENKQLPEFVNSLSNWVETAWTLQNLKSTNSPDTRFIEYVHDLSNQQWQTFREKLQIADNLPSHFMEILDYIKEKGEKGEIIILDSTRYKDSPERQQKKAAEARQMGTSMAMRRYVDEKDTVYNILAFNLDLTSPEINPYELLMGVAHEKGHEFKWKQEALIPGLKNKDDSDVVFDEFFPMLEERRLYTQLPSNVKQTLPARLKEFYEIPVEQQGTFKGSIPHLHSPIQLVNDAANNALTLAYIHAMDQQIKLVQNYQIPPGVSDPQVLERINYLKQSATHTPTLVGQPIQWEKSK